VQHDLDHRLHAQVCTKQPTSSTPSPLAPHVPTGARTLRCINLWWVLLGPTLAETTLVLQPHAAIPLCAPSAPVADTLSDPSASVLAHLKRYCCHSRVLVCKHVHRSGAWETFSAPIPNLDVLPRRGVLLPRPRDLHQRDAYECAPRQMKIARHEHPPPGRGRSTTRTRTHIFIDEVRASFLSWEGGG
jgi:hypothetical protein